MPTFKKHERLTHRKVISLTFESGKVVKKFPFILLYRFDMRRSESPCQVMMSVGKRNFKKAVDRNRIKRLMKESWRLNKAELYKTIPSSDQQLFVILIYTGKTILTFEETQQKIKEVSVRLSSTLADQVTIAKANEENQST
ncbi:MAG: ribonuclease P protein component [Flavobacteriales bacterium]